MQKRNIFLWCVISSLYFSQYVCIGFITVALVAVLREQGASLAQLSLVNAVMLPHALKCLWSPTIDQFHLGKKDHYRNWLIPAQGLIVIALLALAQTTPNKELSVLFSGLLMLMLIIATQDIAIDGIACVAIERAQRPTVNAIQLISGMLGNIVGGGLLLLFYDKLQWQGSLMVLMTISVVGLIMLICFQEPRHHQKQLTKKTSPWKRLWQFWQGQKRWLALLISYPIAISLGFAVLTPVLVDNHWSLGEIGSAIKIYGSLIGLVSALLSAWIIKTLGRQKTIRLFAILQGLGLLLLLPVSLGYPKRLWIYAAITVYFFCFSPLVAAFCTICMDKAAKHSTPATDYTVQYTVFMLFAFLGSAISLNLAQYLGYSTMVIIGALSAAAIGYLTLYLIQEQQHDDAHTN